MMMLVCIKPHQNPLFLMDAVRKSQQTNSKME